MAKLIVYRPNAQRKPGLKKASNKANQLEAKGQLNLFQKQVEKTANSISIKRYLNPFEKASSMDNKDELFAENLYREAIAKDISAPDAWCNLGILEAKRGKTVDAVDCFINSLTKDPKHIEAHYNLANMYFDMGNHQLAVNHYKIALQIDPKFEEAHFNLSLTYLFQQAYKEAQSHMISYIELAKGSDSDALHLLHLLKTASRQ